MTPTAITERSLAQVVADLAPEAREEILAELDADTLAYDPQFWLRPTQLRPIVETGWTLAEMVAGRGAGKMISVSTPVPTPTGWTTMGDLRAGDWVLDEAGAPCRVLAAHPVTVPERAYRLTFTDGTTIDACDEHQWVTWTHRDRKQYLRHGGGIDFPADWPTYRQPTWDRYGNITGEIGPQIRTTQQIVNTFRHSGRGDLNHCIPLTAPLDLPVADLPVDPWLLGYWLGNGTAASGELTTGSKDGDYDADHVVGVLAALGLEFSRHDYEIRGQARINVIGLRPVLRAHRLLGNKHVPAQYLRASTEQRLALLRGLMDSDGYSEPGGKSVEFCSMTEALALSVLELVRTLSERPTLQIGRATLNGQDYGTKYRVSWRPSLHNPFSLPRKAQRVAPPQAQGLRLRHRMIVSYALLDDPPLMRCITVDSPNSMYLAGEGMIPTHNTRSMCEWARHKAQGVPTRGALVARTAADVRDVLVAGESGILAVSPPSERPEYEPSKRLLTWPNGTTALCFSSEAPDQLRGPQFHWSLADELASWKYLPDESGLTAWDNLRLATRLGEHPQIFAGTTPKRTPFMRSLIKAAEDEPGVLLLRGSTKDNQGNLSQTYIDMIYGLYAGTMLAQQELEGIMLDDIDGALWSEEMLEEARVTALPKLRRPLIVVGCDPSVSEKPGDETGIVVVVVDAAIRDMYRRHAYVLSDASVQASPEVWAKLLVGESRRWGGAPVIAETNQGGGLIKAVLTGIDPTVRVLGVHSRFGKAIRAEPIQLASQQGRIHHVGYFPELEDQLCSWVPDETKKSPDRLDAYVHALTSVLVKAPEGLWAGGVRAYSPSRRSIPSAPRPRFRGPTTTAARRSGGGSVR